MPVDGPVSGPVSSGRWPALLELVDVQPARGLDAAEMSGGGGPKGRHRRSGPCERGRRSTQRNGERFANGHVLDARVETVLPNVANGATGGALRGIAEGGVLAIQIHHEERDGIGPVADGDEVKVIGHQGVGGDPNLALFVERADRVRK